MYIPCTSQAFTIGIAELTQSIYDNMRRLQAGKCAQLEKLRTLLPQRKRTRRRSEKRGIKVLLPHRLPQEQGIASVHP